MFFKKLLCTMLTMGLISVSSAVYAENDVQYPTGGISNCDIQAVFPDNINITVTDEPLEYDTKLTPFATDTSDESGWKYYNTLNDEEKEIYTALGKYAEEIKDGDVSQIPIKDIKLQGKTTYTSDEEIQEDLNNLYSNFIEPYDTYINRAFYAFVYDNPQYFWIDTVNSFKYGVYGDVTYIPSTGVFSCTLSLLSSDNCFLYDFYKNDLNLITEEETKINNVTDEIIASIPNNASDFMKIKYFNDWLCDHNTYNPKYATANSEVSDYAYFISGALIYGDGDDTSKYPVCQAYALSMKLLCDKVGINDMVAVSSNHMWNIVEVNGKKYYVDTTWNDNWADAKYPTIYSYKYLCIGTDKMKSRDDSKSSHTIVDRYDVSDYLPDTTSLLEDLNIHTESSNFEYSNLDENSDNELDYQDIAIILKNINNPTTKLPYNVNGSTDNKVDLLDAITLSKLMLK